MTMTKARLTLGEPYQRSPSRAPPTSSGTPGDLGIVRRRLAGLIDRRHGCYWRDSG
jgi:hypothetical protein